MARRVAALAAQGDPRFEKLGVKAVVDLSGVINPRGSLLHYLMNTQKVLLEQAKGRLEQWKRDDKFGPFNNQRFWLKDGETGWETYNAPDDLKAISPTIPYVYVVGDRDNGILNRGVEAEYGSAQYEDLAISQPVADFLKAVEQRGIPPLIWPNLQHEYAGPSVPADAPANVLDRTIDHIIQHLPAAGLEELAPLAQPIPPVQQVPAFIQALQQERLVEIDGYTYLQQGRHGGEVPDEIIRAGIVDPKGVQPGERRFAVLLDAAPSADLLEIAQLFDQIGVPPKAVPERARIVSAAPRDKAWGNPQAVNETREKVSRDITDLDAFLVDATHVTVEGISDWIRPGVKSTIVRISPTTLNALLAERPDGQDIESILRAAHRKQGEVFDVEEVAIVNYQGYRVAIMRAA